MLRFYWVSFDRFKRVNLNRPYWVCLTVFSRICKDFAGNRVNELGNVPRCGVVPKFSDLEVIALGITDEAFGSDSENYLFHRLHHECKEDLPNLISHRQFNARRKQAARLAEEIRKDVAVAIDGSEDVFCIDSKPIKVCQNARAKRCAM